MNPKTYLTAAGLALFASFTIAQAFNDKYVQNPYTQKSDNVGKFDYYSGTYRAGLNALKNYTTTHRVTDAHFTLLSSQTWAHQRSVTPYGGHPAAGSNRQVQYNNAGTTAGSAQLNYSGSRFGVGTTSPGTLVHIYGSDSGTTDVVEQLRLDRNSTGTPAAGFGVKDTRYLEIGGSQISVAENEYKLATVTAGTEKSTYTLRKLTEGSLRDSMVITDQPVFYRYLPAGTFSTPQAAATFALKKGNATMATGTGPRMAFQTDNDSGIALVAGAISYLFDFTNTRSDITFNVRGSSSDTFATTEAIRATYDKHLGIATTAPRGTFDNASSSGGKTRWYGGSATNYIYASQDLGVRLKGNSTTWDDLRVEPTARSGAGIGTAPAFASSPWDALLFNYMFANSPTAEYLYFNVQMPHNWLEASSIYPHVHFTPHTTGTGQVDFTIRCSWATPVTGTFGAGSDYTVSYNIATNSQYKHLMASNATPVSMASMAASSVASCRITRSMADTYAGDVSVLYLDIHYEIDSMGSDDRTTKTATP